MSKTAPTVTNTPAAAASDTATKAFRDVTHSGHAITHVGSFSDGKPDNVPYDVWYCRNDHALFIG